jgi:hypothetical protein
MTARAGLLAMCLVVQALQAQTDTTLAKGARVRVAIPTSAQSTRYVTGSLVRLRGDTVALTPTQSPSDTVIYHLGVASGMQLERAMGSRGHTVEGLFVGALLGGVVGGVAGHASNANCKSWCFEDLAVGVGVGIGAAGGGLLGGLVGHGTRSEKWVSVHTAGLRIALAPRRVGVSVTF